MRSRFGLSLLVLLILGLGIAYVLTEPKRAVGGPLPPRVADRVNGETMFHIGGCASCHATPGQADTSKLGGGLALQTTFGTFKVPNISSDAASGIGGWTEAQFLDAMLSGVGRDGQHLYPSFPYTSYQRMRIDDVRDLYAFLRTVPPDPTVSQPHQLPFPFGIRRGLGLWKQLFLDGRAFVADPDKDGVYNRGAYLVEGPGHCAECHSARNMLGGIEAQRRFAGGLTADGKGWVPNITPHRDGLADWSIGDLETFLRTGLAPAGNSVEGEMEAVIANIAKLPASDRAAMAVYLKALPARPGSRPKRTP